MTEEYTNILALLDITWGRWIMISLFALLVYWLIRLLKHWLEKASLLGGWNYRIYRLVLKIYILSEPLCALVIIGGFVLINPIVHGIIALVILLLGYSVIKSYFSGKVLQMSYEFFEGQKIKVKENEGIIQEIGRTSLVLQTKLGAEHISYVQLFENGFTQLEGAKVGGLQAIYIDGGAQEGVTIQSIKDKLWESPYLDWSFTPEIALTNKENQFEVKVLLREKHHLEDLKNLITEWGYMCRLKN